METKQLVCSVPEAGRLVGLGRDSSYEAARRGDLPTIQIGKLLKVPLAMMEQKLGLEPGTLTTQKHETGNAPSTAREQGDDTGEAGLKSSVEE